MENSEKEYKKAREMYYFFKKQGLKPLVYNIKNSKIIYTSKDNLGIAKGTCFPDVIFPNFYKIDQISNGQKVTTFRCGVTNSVTEKDLKGLIRQINTMRPLKEKKPIVLSLVGACTTRLCKFVKATVNISGVFPKTLANSLNEDHIIETLKNCENVLPLFIPLRPQKIIGLYTSHGIKNAERINNNDFAALQNLIKVDTIENTFKSIVDIGAYYFKYLKNKYNLLTHCRSSKDRNSIADCILRATFDCIMAFGKIDYNYIKVNSSNFLEPGLIIAYFSTHIYGLKLKQLPLAHFILKDNKLKRLSRQKTSSNKKWSSKVHSITKVNYE